MPPRDPFILTDDHLDQGDILADVPLGKWKDGQHTVGHRGRAVITSHGCACEDYERAINGGRTQAAAKLMLQVAPLRSAAGTQEHRLDEIRSGKQLDSFYIYGRKNVLSDQVLDFSREQPVPASVLANCTKITRLAPWQWQALLVHLAVSRFHQEPSKLFLPELLQPRDDDAT